ncbi:MAG TPA: hypothetical protein V6D47_11350 [Oscillatoriaceae cyanobacterium]
MKTEQKGAAKANKHGHLKGSKSGIQFKKLTPQELVEFNTRRANGESEEAIAADFKRRRRD